MGKTADLAMVQKTIIDTLHKGSKSQMGITEMGGCSQSAVSKHNKCKVYWKAEIFCISFGNQGLESGGRVERHRSCLKSIVFYQVHRQCSCLPGDFGALLTSFMEMLISFSSSTCPQC